MMFDKLGLIMVVVADMARSVAFYRDVLGMKMEFETAEWSQFDMSGVSLGLHAATAHLPANGSVSMSMGFYTDDLEALVTAVAGRGGPAPQRVQESFGEIAIFQDPDGYSIQVCQMKQQGW